MDTTGLAYRREDRFLRFRRGEEVRRVRGHARLLALVRWERERRLLLPWGGVAGRGYAPDPRLGGKARGEARVRAREGWDPEVYRFRGVVEGVFGGMKTRLSGVYLWERKPWTAMVRAFLELIAYGLRVLLSLLPPPPGYRLDRYAARGVKEGHDPT
jgi:hypothetical protein